MTLENIKYSFVQMSSGNIPPCDNSYFPVSSGTDVVFQFIMKAANATELGYLTTTHPIRLYYDGVMEAISTFWEFKDLGNNEVLIYIPLSGVPEINDLPDGQCFRFAFLYASSVNILPFSSCFKKIADNTATTLLKYSNPVDQNGFYYCDVPGYENSIRLPMLISEISFESVSNIYKYSDGRVKKTSSRVNKILHFLTDWLPFEMLDYLSAAIESQNISVESDMYTGSIVANTVVTPETNTDLIDMRLKPRATFTAYATPYDINTNLCESCN